MESQYREVLASIRILTNAAERSPIDPLTVDVVPAVPVGLGTWSELIPIRVKAEFFKARFGQPILEDVEVIGEGGQPEIQQQRIKEERAHPIEFPRPAGGTENLGNLLSVTYLFAPIIEGTGSNGSESVELLLTITVHASDLQPPILDLDVGELLNHEATKGHRQISIPFALPRLAVPAFAIIGTGYGLEKYTSGEPNATVLFTPTGSGISSVENAIETVSQILSLLTTLAGLVEFVSGLIAPLSLLTRVLPAPEYDIRIGDVEDLESIGADADWVDDGQNFGDQNGSLLLVCPLNQRLRLWYNNGFEGGKRDLAPVPLTNVLNPPPDDARAIFVRRQLDRMLKKHGIEGLPELPPGAPGQDLPPTVPVPEALNLGLVCIHNWKKATVNSDPVLLSRLSAQQRTAIKNDFYEFDDDDKMVRNVEALEWLTV